MLKALSHPLRQRILAVLDQRVASPSGLARELGEPLGKVSYHVKVLLEHDAIELVRTAPVRGAVEHFYRATARSYLDDEHWARLPASTRRALFDQTLQQIWQHLAEAAEQGGLEDPRTHVSWTILELDSEGYDAIANLLATTLDRAVQLGSEASERLAQLSPGGREAERSELVVLHFHWSE